MIERDVVIVIDLGNYKSEYSEEIPFKAKIINIVEDDVEKGFSAWVESLTTGNKYELYFHQILEALDIEEIRSIIDYNKI